jgi:hypothetical protein
VTGRGTLLAMWALTLFGCPGAGEPPCDQPKPWHRDVDGDGFGGAETQRACAAPDQGWVAEDGDCDDTSAAVFPGAEPSCDGPDDDDCDGVPDLLTADADGDGASTCAGDCDDADATKAPAAAELCNGVDDDCDGLVDLDDGFADPWTCGFCPDPHGELPFEEFTRRRRDVNPCFLDPTISLCRDGVTSVDTLEDGERLHTITWPTMPWGRRPQLLLWLPPGPGTHTDTVQQWGAYAGYRLINLGWPNDNSTDNLCRRRKDLDCFEAVHRERLFGIDVLEGLDAVRKRPACTSAARAVLATACTTCCGRSSTTRGRGDERPRLRITVTLQPRRQRQAPAPCRTTAAASRSTPMHPKSRSAGAGGGVHHAARRRQVRRRRLQRVGRPARRRRLRGQRLSSASRPASGANGKEWSRSSATGPPDGPRRGSRPARGTGTTVTFDPDPEIFDDLEFDPERIRKRLEIKAFLNRGLRITFKDKVARRTASSSHDGGVADYLAACCERDKAHPGGDAPFTCCERAGAAEDRLASPGPSSRASGVTVRQRHPHPDGGTHEQGLRDALVKALRAFIDTHGLSPAA